MYTEEAMKQFKNIWSKDENTFQYCISLLKNKLTMLEYYELNCYYYIQNANFEKAVDCLCTMQADPNLKIHIERSDNDDFLSDLICCIGIDTCCEGVCDGCNDCCCCELCGETTCGNVCSLCCTLSCAGGVFCWIWDCCCKGVTVNL
ncbi:MAG: hypothetical protein Q4C58_11535 [Eubacteriales bacterium]|nr:hypothetical protein [Eubacteriales bacterium]